MRNDLLVGIVGSTAYNLAHKDSDIDKKGIFAFDTRELFGLNYAKLTDVYSSNNPDITMYEVAKWCNLALKCNPNILELLYLPDDLYTVRTSLGNDLISMRSEFLSAENVKGSYINYARSQLHQIENHGHFGSDMKKRTEKHARHLVRLMIQGFQLYSTGNLTVRLPDGDVIFVRGVATQAGKGDLFPLKNAYEQFKGLFEETKTVLPKHPNRTAVEQWVKHVREYFLN